MKKEVINFDENRFEIKVMPHGEAYGLELIKENGREHLLCQHWTINECREYIYTHFIGEKGTKLQLTIEEGEIVKDENGFLHLEPKKV